jgi:hypothetical protein
MILQHAIKLVKFSSLTKMFERFGELTNYMSNKAVTNHRVRNPAEAQTRLWDYLG